MKTQFVISCSEIFNVINERAKTISSDPEFADHDPVQSVVQAIVNDIFQKTLGSEGTRVFLEESKSILESHGFPPEDAHDSVHNAYGILIENIAYLIPGIRFNDPMIKAAAIENVFDLVITVEFPDAPNHSSHR